MKYLLCLLLGLAFLQGRAQENRADLTAKLRKLGFENIRIVENGERVFICMENNVYRWDVEGLTTALDTLAAYSAANTQLSVYWLKNDVPQIQINVPAQVWKQYRSGLLTSGELADRLQVDYEIDDNWPVLKSQMPVNANINKIDLVVYPQLSIQNRKLTPIYEVQFNIAPALELSLWKGMLFTGQVIFPLRNDMEVLDIEENEDYKDRNFLYVSHEGDYIRPGFITISQDIRLPRQWFGNLTAGNFNTHRYGIKGKVYHPLKGNRWSIGGEAGYTGSSHFLQGRWVSERLNAFTWKTMIGYFYPRYNVQLALSYGGYLNNDKGFRADCTRHFGETAIGFYAMNNEGNYNGGFKFTIPIPCAKRNRKHTLRLRAPNYFDSDYNAAYAVYYGKDFETGPYENQSDNNFQPLFIKNIILNQ